MRKKENVFTEKHGCSSTMGPSYIGLVALTQVFADSPFLICVLTDPSENLVVFRGKNPAAGTSRKPHHRLSTRGNGSRFLRLLSSDNCQEGAPPPIRGIWKDLSLSERGKRRDREVTIVAHDVRERFCNPGRCPPPQPLHDGVE